MEPRPKLAEGAERLRAYCRAGAAPCPSLQPRPYQEAVGGGRGVGGGLAPAPSGYAGTPPQAQASAGQALPNLPPRRAGPPQGPIASEIRPLVCDTRAAHKRARHAAAGVERGTEHTLREAGGPYRVLGNG
jgi:hypothetical protein